MIACVYGRAFAPFVEPAARDLCAAAAVAGGEMRPLTLEAAMADHRRGADVHRLYVLPFDPPERMSAGAIIRELFPRAEVVISFPLQELCWDKIATQELLLERGVPVPDTLITSEPADVHRFVQEHGFVMLKERYACGGQGHVVVWLEDGELVGDSGSHHYRMELVPHGRRRVDGERLTYPAPFYVQRLVATSDRVASFPHRCCARMSSTTRSRFGPNATATATPAVRLDRQHQPGGEVPLRA